MKSVIFSKPNGLAASKATEIPSDAMPVDMIRGFFSCTYRMRGMSTISNEAILYAGAPSSSKGRPLSHQMASKNCNPNLSACSKSVFCHSKGVSAHL